jgi:hypothetical protein
VTSANDTAFIASPNAGATKFRAPGLRLTSIPNRMK